MLSLPTLPAIYEQFCVIRSTARERFAGSLGGKVLLSTGPDGLPSIIAASIAGAASFWVDSEAETLRAAMRAGLCDFVVGTLDEALRILKNEVRQQRPVSVGLHADPASCLRECIDRGFQPDLLMCLPASLQQQMPILVERGAVLLPDSGELEDGTSLLCWTVDSDAARTMRRIGQIAAESLDPNRADTPDRQRWLEVAPRYLRRAFANQQCVRMDRDESAKFAAHMRSEFPAVRLSTNAAGT
ncbi:MAG TPA: hypothetical protein VJS11_10500 [Acidobacteriaceae bacterium]|nr:hypothetical protein [Acidobacteriaceae bacterium]